MIYKFENKMIKYLEKIRVKLIKYYNLSKTKTIIT